MRWKTLSALPGAFRDVIVAMITLLLDRNSNALEHGSMLIKVTSKRQVTFPAAVLAALGAGPGSHLELQQRGDGFLLRARRIDGSKLAPLRGLVGKTNKVFDLEKFRGQSHDPSLRD